MQNCFAGLPYLVGSQNLSPEFRLWQIRSAASGLSEFWLLNSSGAGMQTLRLSSRMGWKRATQVGRSSCLGRSSFGREGPLQLKLLRHLPLQVVEHECLKPYIQKLHQSEAHPQACDYKLRWRLTFQGHLSRYIQLFDFRAKFARIPCSKHKLGEHSFTIGAAIHTSSAGSCGQHREHRQFCWTVQGKSSK